MKLLIWLKVQYIRSYSEPHIDYENTTEIYCQTLLHQMELMEHYSKIDELDFALSTAEEKSRVQNDNLIDQNNALMHALQVELPVLGLYVGVYEYS